MMLRTALRAATRVPGFATTRAAARQQQRSASTVAGILDEAVKDIPWREVAKDKQAEVKWSVSDLQRETYALANGLGELGLGPGDSIITILPTNAENLVATLAAASLGVNVLPTQPTSAGSLEVLLTQSGAKGVIFDSGQAQGVIDELLPKVTEQMLYLKDLDRIEDERFPALDLVVTTDYDLTDNGVINYRQMFMYNNVNRCQVKRASKIIDADTAVVGGASNKDIIAAAGWCACASARVGAVCVCVCVFFFFFLAIAALRSATAANWCVVPSCVFGCFVLPFVVAALPL